MVSSPGSLGRMRASYLEGKSINAYGHLLRAHTNSFLMWRSTLPYAKSLDMTSSNNSAKIAARALGWVMDRRRSSSAASSFTPELLKRVLPANAAKSSTFTNVLENRSNISDFRCSALSLAVAGMLRECEVRHTQS